MDVKEAVKAAKQWVSSILEEEGIAHLGLEEVEYNTSRDQWEITLGFSRPWNSVRNALTAITGEPTARRAYRVITVDNKTGSVVSMRKRDAETVDA